MKNPDHVKEVDAIGNESFDLLHFNQLPKAASARAQIAALRADRRWLEEHHNEVIQRLDQLIMKLQFSDENSQRIADATHKVLHDPSRSKKARLEKLSGTSLKDLIRMQEGK